jgi:hypothetical protein
LAVTAWGSGITGQFSFTIPQKEIHYNNRMERGDPLGMAVAEFTYGVVAADLHAQFESKQPPGEKAREKVVAYSRRYKNAFQMVKTRSRW